MGLFKRNKTSDNIGEQPFYQTSRTSFYVKVYSNRIEFKHGMVHQSILMVCENERIQKKLNRQIRKALDDSYEDDIKFATTTKQQFQHSQAKDKIWQRADDPEVITTLRHIPHDRELSYF